MHFLPLIEPTIWCFKLLNPQYFYKFYGFFFKYDTISWNFLASFFQQTSGKLRYLFGRSSHSVCFSVKKTFLFFSKEIVRFCLFFTHVERVFFGTPYFATTSLFAIPFPKSFKPLHFTPIGLLFNLRFRGTIFLSQRTKNGLFEFATLCLCFQKLNAWFENVGMFEF